MKIFEVTEAEYQIPNHELDNKSRQATAMAQKLEEKSTAANKWMTWITIN